MPRIGATELIIILIILLLLFGASRLPQLGSSVGRAIREFRDSISGSGEKKAETEAKTKAGKKKA